MTARTSRVRGRTQRSAGAHSTRVVRRRTERGAVTAELALVLPAVVVVLLVCAALGASALGQLRCADAARAAARAAAIGEPVVVVEDVARDLAGADAQVSVTRDGGWVEVVVSRPVAAGPTWLGELRAEGAARAWVEPGVGP